MNGKGGAGAALYARVHKAEQLWSNDVPALGGKHMARFKAFWAG